MVSRIKNRKSRHQVVRNPMQYIEKIFTRARPTFEICSKKNTLPEHVFRKGAFRLIKISYLVGVGLLFGVVVPPISFAIAMFFVVFSRAAAS